MEQGEILQMLRLSRLDVVQVTVGKFIESNDDPKRWKVPAQWLVVRAKKTRRSAQRLEGATKKQRLIDEEKRQLCTV